MGCNQKCTKEQTVIDSDVSIHAGGSNHFRGARTNVKVDNENKRQVSVNCGDVNIRCRRKRIEGVVIKRHID